MNQENIMC